MVTYAQSGSATASADDEIYWGRRVPNVVSSETAIHTVSPRVLSDNWLGLVNTASPATTEVNVEPKMLGIGGTRNATYHMKGVETAGSASLDVNLNQGTWLHYALGATTVTLPSSGLGSQITNSMDYGTAPTDGHKTLIALNSAGDGVAGNSAGPFFHRVLKGSDAICPPLLPDTSAKQITAPAIGGDGQLDNALTYTFTERNDNTLPSFAFELVAEKGGNLSSSPMVDRGSTTRQDATTFETKDNVYAQIHPGASMESLSLTAAEGASVTANMTFNIKRTFECPTGYVGRAYDATNNITSGANLPRKLYNFGQISGLDTDVKQEMLTPFYFSDGTISLFGNEFMRVTNFTLDINNALTDKRFIGQYNKQIKNVVTGTRSYTINITAQLTDRRLFTELRNETAFRNALSHSNVQLLLTKADGERIKLQFDDFMVSVANYPGPTEDRGPLEVSFTIMPIRLGTTVDASTHWVLQG